MEGIQRQVSAVSLMSDDEDVFEVNYKNIATLDEKRWTRGHLRSLFKTLELNKLFQKYTNKIYYGFFSLFLILTFFLFSAHAILLFYETYRADQIEAVIPDLVLYSSVSFLSVLGLIFLEIVKRRNRQWKYFCAIAFAITFLTNFFPPLYHDLISNAEGINAFTPAYTFLLVIGSYIFFAVGNNWLAALLGVGVSIVHTMVMVFFTYKTSEILVWRVFSDIIFLVCFNGLGLYFRYLNEIVQRKSFLDRRECIVNTLQLRHEKEQEEQLMASIIPAPLINKVKQNLLRNQEYFNKTGKMGVDRPQELLEIYDNVTILFADIVNYTVMTKKLNINSLLEVLNEMFGRFDEASERLRVIRIKFLGDCYYCVSGLPPEPPPNPAEACVDLGLKMIKIIADVRERNNLTIDMRIGIHTGKTVCGIIGKVKYQFDVWSKDVDLANKMESEGVAGKVHITNATRDLLEKPYDIQPTHKGETVPQFKSYNLKTYIVSPMPDHPKTSPQESIFQKTLVNTPPPRASIFRKNGEFPILNLQIPSHFLDQSPDLEPTPRASIFRKKGLPLGNLQEVKFDLPEIDEGPRSTLTIIESNNLDQDQRRTNGDGRRNTIYQKRASNRFRVNEDRRLTADTKRRTAFMSTNFKRYTERSANVDREMERTIHNMSFSKKDQYIKEKDISSLLIFRNKKNELEYVKMKDPMFKYYVLSQVVLILCVYLVQNLTLNSDAWLRFEFIFSQLIILVVLLPSTWTYFLYLRYYTKYVDNVPENRVVRFFYHLSKYISYNFWARLLIYTLVWILFLCCVFFEVWFCHEQSMNDLDGSINEELCMVPWHMTESCALALIMTFIFLKMFIWIKLLYAVITTVAYSYCVLYYVSPIYRNSETFNPFLPPELSHVFSIVFLTFTLHLIDRQTDYMNRLDFLWTSKLMEDKRKADEQQAVNTNMLINILPKHVAKIYLDVNKEMNDLYYETHNHAAVMFASIIFDDAYMEEEMPFLQLMNEYITIIDTLINRKEFSKVEKIKIAKWTYMAACGLTIPGENDNVGHVIESHHTSSTLEVLLNFASDMFKKFKEANGITYDIQLRIGICHGPIVAGVVGSKKPLYDIWGDAVNMASRMDSTGSPGQIQVLEQTAQEIENLGYECIPRGMRKVKGVGEVPTFFVRLDEQFNLVKRRKYSRDEYELTCGD